MHPTCAWEVRIANRLVRQSSCIQHGHGNILSTFIDSPGKFVTMHFKLPNENALLTSRGGGGDRIWEDPVSAPLVNILCL